MAQLGTALGRGARMMGLCLVWAAAAPAAAQPAPAPNVVALARVVPTPATTSDSLTESALRHLIVQIRRRTTLALADRIALEPLELPQLLAHPMLVWRGEGHVALSAAQREALRLHLSRGGTLWVDAADGDIHGPFATSVRDVLNELWSDTRLTPLAQDFVLWRSFYLLRGQIGRKAVPTPLRGLMRDGRLAVLMSEGDVLGALAKRKDGSWALPTEGSDAAREMALRLAINWLMYAVCLDYKDDQVHLPFILKRRSL